MIVGHRKAWSTQPVPFRPEVAGAAVGFIWWLWLWPSLFGLAILCASLCMMLARRRMQKRAVRQVAQKQSRQAKMQPQNRHSNSPAAPAAGCIRGGSGRANQQAHSGRSSSWLSGKLVLIFAPAKGMRRLRRFEPGKNHRSADQADKEGGPMSIDHKQHVAGSHPLDDSARYGRSAGDRKRQLRVSLVRRGFSSAACGNAIALAWWPNTTTASSAS